MAGWTSDPSAPIGRWHKRKIDGVEYDYFATSYVAEPIHKRPLIPARATSLFQFRRFGREILSCGIRNILTQDSTVMMALPFTNMHNVCYWFAGVNSALSVSRYEWAKPLAPLFDAVLYRRVRRFAGTILAAADEESIADLRRRTKGVFDGTKIHFFPTRVDTTLFHPGDQPSARKELLLPLDRPIVMTSGRLHRAKGWALLLEAFNLFRHQHPTAKFLFVGDGNDRVSIEAKMIKMGLGNNIIVVGYQPPQKLALYLQAADLFVMGSEKEGWSTSLVEALACGLPMVSTHFSRRKNDYSGGGKWIRGEPRSGRFRQGNGRRFGFKKCKGAFSHRS